MKSLMSIFIIAVCIGTYFVYIKPLSVEVKALNVKKAEYADVLSRVKEIKEKRDAILLDYDSISPDDIDRLNKIIPETVDPTTLANDISNLGSKYGISVKDFKVNEPSGGQREGVVGDIGQVYKTTSVSVALTGGYSQFLEFLSEVESGLSLFDIIKLNVKPGAQSGNQANQSNYTFTLEANVYSLR